MVSGGARSAKGFICLRITSGSGDLDLLLASRSLLTCGRFSISVTLSRTEASPAG